MPRDFSKQKEKEDEILKKYASQKQKIKIREQEIRQKQRKRADHEKIVLGGLLKKSGINLNNNELLGMLLEIKEKMEKDL